MCHAMKLKQDPKLFRLYISMVLFFILKITNNFFMKSQIIPNMIHLFQLKKKNPFLFKFSGQYSIK